jgi:hypothetical protein
MGNIKAFNTFDYTIELSYRIDQLEKPFNVSSYERIQL